MESSVESEAMDHSYRTPPQSQSTMLRRPWDSPMDTNPAFMSTPKASAAKRIRRDDGGRVNPFDRHLLDRLHQSSWSPSILGNINAETPPQKNWAIDEIALLNPMSIEDSPSTHQNETVLTPQTEAKAQEAIGRFFSQSSLGPSPPISPISSNSNNKWSYEKLSSINGSSTDVILHKSLPIGDRDEETTETEVNTSINPRKLEFSFEFSSDLDEDETEDADDLSGYSPPRPGTIVHSPGAQDFEGSSPRHSRIAIGMRSPCTTPIPPPTPTNTDSEYPRNPMLLSSPCAMSSPRTPATPINRQQRIQYFQSPSPSDLPSPISMLSPGTPIRR